MTTPRKKPNRVAQVENRLDRVERMLEQLTERQIHADNRLDRFEQALIASTQATQNHIDQLSAQIGFLLQAVKGHNSQPTPPAHSAD